MQANYDVVPGSDVDAITVQRRESNDHTQPSHRGSTAKVVLPPSPEPKEPKFDADVEAQPVRTKTKRKTFGDDLESRLHVPAGFAAVFQMMKSSKKARDILQIFHYFQWNLVGDEPTPEMLDRDMARSPSPIFEEPEDMPLTQEELDEIEHKTNTTADSLALNTAEGAKQAQQTNGSPKSTDHPAADHRRGISESSDFQPQTGKEGQNMHHSMFSQGGTNKAQPVGRRRFEQTAMARICSGDDDLAEGNLGIEALLERYKRQLRFRAPQSFSMSCFAFRSKNNPKLVPFVPRLATDAEGYDPNYITFRFLLKHFADFTGWRDKKEQEDVLNAWQHEEFFWAHESLMKLPRRERIWKRENAQKSKSHADCIHPTITTLKWVNPPKGLFTSTSRLTAPWFYTRQPYRENVKLKGATLLCQCNLEHSHLLVALDSAETLSSFKDYVGDSRLVDFSDSFALDEPKTMSALMVAICCELMIVDAEHFLASADEFIHQTLAECRDQPRRSKFLKLALLEDYVFVSRQCLSKNQKIIRSWTKEALPNKLLNHFAQSTLAELKQITKEHDTIQNKLNRAFERAKLLSDTKQAQTTGILAFIAGIYAPLAFVCAFFGMNTTDIVSGGKLEMSLFWEIAGPLAFASVVIPLGAGKAARFSYKGASRMYFELVQSARWIMRLVTVLFVIGVGSCITRIVHAATVHQGFVGIFREIVGWEAAFWNFLVGTLLLPLGYVSCRSNDRRYRALSYIILFDAGLFLLCGGLSWIDHTGVATLITPWFWAVTSLLLGWWVILCALPAKEKDVA